MFSKVKIVAGDGLVTNHRPEITAQVGYSIVAGHRGHHQTEEVTHAYSITSLTVGGRILLRVMAGEKDTIINKQKVHTIQSTCTGSLLLG